MTRICRPVLIVALLGALLGAPAAAKPRYGIGLHAPGVPFTGPAQRYTYVSRLAQHLSRALDAQVTGFAYVYLRDFQRDQRLRRIHFAIVDGVSAAGMTNVTVLAQAVVPSKAESLWSVMSKRNVELAALKGKSLQVPNMGRLTDRFVQNALLGGAVDVPTEFVLQKSPDVTSAISAVQLGRADACVAPINAKGLNAVVGGLHVPPPALILLDHGVPADVVKQVTAAIVSFGADLASLSGWRAGDSGEYRALSNATRKKTYRMVLALPTTSKLPVDELLLRSQTDTEMPALEDLFWVP